MPDIIEPAVVLTPGDPRYLDSQQNWLIGHELTRTSRQQAALLVRAARQAELIRVRVECAQKLYNQTTVISAENMIALYALLDHYETHARPEVAARVRAMIERGADIFATLPQAALAQFLIGHGLG